jgi:hypothetical protein
MMDDFDPDEKVSPAEVYVVLLAMLVAALAAWVAWGTTL